ncbi:MAG: hypothetical protein Kow0037_00110 [Calditrichia bacterium]
MEIKNHRLEGEGIAYQPSPNRGGELRPDAIVIHYTAGRDVQSAVATLCNPDVRASAHLVIGRVGEIYQLVPFNRVAWHAGKSSFGGREGYNGYSIGIELDNAGLLTRNGTRYYSWFGREYPESEVFYGVHRNQQVARYWHRYTERQIELTETLCRLLMAKYPIREILGHEEISPHRKIDPGPAFPLDKLRYRLLMADRSGEEGDELILPAPGRVNTSRLNIREEPSLHSEKIARPLPEDQPVTVLEKKGEWYRVSTVIEGWVAAKYIEIDSPKEVS